MSGPDKQDVDHLFKLIHTRKSNHKQILANNLLIKQLKDKKEQYNETKHNNPSQIFVDICIFEDKNEFIHFVNQQFNTYFNQDPNDITLINA